MRVKPDLVQVIDPRDVDFEDLGLEKGTSLRRDLDIKTKGAMLNRIIDLNSWDTTQLFVSIPTPPQDDDFELCSRYLQGLRKLTEDLPPSAMVINGQNITFVSAGM